MIYIYIYIYYLTLDDPLIYNIYMDNVYIYIYDYLLNTNDYDLLSNSSWKITMNEQLLTVIG